MLPRLLPVLFVFLLLACAPGQESTSTTDSLATDSLAIDSTVAVADSTTEFQFDNNDLFVKPLPFELSDDKVLAKWYPNGTTMDVGFDKEDGTPWYRYRDWKNEEVEIDYYDYFDNDRQRFYFNGIVASGPSIEFAKGLKTGMSKEDFLKAFGLSDPAAALSNNIWINQAPGEHRVNVVFKDGKVSYVKYIFDYGESAPNNIYTFLDDWTQIDESDGEGETEQTVPCGPRAYGITEFQMPVGDQEVDRYTLLVGMVQDSRVDTIEWIRKSEDGFIIRAHNSYNSQSPYDLRVTFPKIDDWTVAEWGGTLFSISSHAENLFHFPCDGQEP